jgi:hypothetical protein
MVLHRSAALNREAHTTHDSLEQALAAAWALSWRDGEVLRIEGPFMGRKWTALSSRSIRRSGSSDAASMVTGKAPSCRSNR